MTKESTKYKPLSESDYLIFNEMISRIRALEHVATTTFFEGESDRSKMAETVGSKADEIQKMLFGTRAVRCSYPFCPGSGVCIMCLYQAPQRLLAERIANSESVQTPTRKRRRNDGTS